MKFWLSFFITLASIPPAHANFCRNLLKTPFFTFKNIKLSPAYLAVSKNSTRETRQNFENRLTAYLHHFQRPAREFLIVRYIEIQDAYPLVTLKGIEHIRNFLIQMNDKPALAWRFSKEQKAINHALNNTGIPIFAYRLVNSDGTKSLILVTFENGEPVLDVAIVPPYVYKPAE